MLAAIMNSNYEYSTDRFDWWKLEGVSGISSSL